MKETLKGLELVAPHLAKPDVMKCLDLLMLVQEKRAALFRKYKTAFGEFQEVRRQEAEAMEKLKAAYDYLRRVK